VNQLQVQMVRVEVAQRAFKGVANVRRIGVAVLEGLFHYQAQRITVPDRPMPSA
jgi:hypothetical protein